MTIKEKVAYLEGLADGMSIKSSEHGKLFSAIIDTLGSIAKEIEELNENALDIGEELDAISDDLAEVEDFLLDEDYEDDDDFDFDFDEDDYDDDDDDDYEDEDDDEEYGCNLCGGKNDDDDDDEDDDVEFSIDVNCPECNAEIELNEEDIANKSVTCPACNKLIELQIEEVDTDEDFDD